MSERRTARRDDQPDVARGRAIVIGAAIALFFTAIGVAAASSGSSARSVGPLSRPHARAKVACASCHGADESAPPSCAGCHAANLHTSTRAGHRALAQKGALTCATCHPAHGNAYGVTFADEGNATLFRADAEKALSPRLTAPKGTTVPLVSLARCSSCHTLTSPTDPIARCIDAGGFSKCWDEHDRAGEPRPASGVCGKQHSVNRFVAWEAAASVMNERPPEIARPSSTRGSLFAASFGLVSGLFAYAFVARKRKVVVVKSSEAPPQKKRLPVIDPETCLGCYACVDACPFDVIEIKRYVAHVERPSDCCGVVLCEQVCPNGSLVISESERKDPGPRLDPHGESADAPGLFLAGDLTGLPLIKNAIAQGARVIERVEHRLKEKSPAPPHAFDVDVVIVGAGPAGLSAALAAKQAKLKAVTFEQGEIAASIRAFPRDKLVYDAPLSIPVEGPLEFKEATKEDLVATWTRLVRKHALPIEARTRVASVVRDESGFVVSVDTAAGASKTVRARFVVLAIGKHGTPRPWDAEVTDVARRMVHRFLADARSFEGKRVVVVGLGDSAMEAGIAIAKQPGAHVTLVHRGADFARGRPRNIAEVKHLVKKGSIDLRFQRRVARVSAGLVELAEVRAEATVAGPREPDTLGADAIEADAVLVLIGGEPAWDLLERAGITRNQNFSAERTSNGDGESP